MITTQKDLRQDFWNCSPHHKRVPGYTQNDYGPDIRSAFVEYVDNMARCGLISETLAARVTL